MRQALARSPGGDDVSPIKRRSAKQPAVETSKKVFRYRLSSGWAAFQARQQLSHLQTNTRSIASRDIWGSFSPLFR